MSEHRDIDCPVCHATPENQDVRVITGGVDGSTTQIRHTADCVDYEPPRVRPGEDPAS